MVVAIFGKENLSTWGGAEKNWRGQIVRFGQHFQGSMIQMMQGFVADDAGYTYVF